MTSKLEEYKYLFEQDFLKIVKEDPNDKNNPWVKLSDKFKDLLQAKLMELTVRFYKSEPDSVLVYAIVQIIKDSDANISEEHAMKYGHYLYNSLKDHNLYEGTIKILADIQRGVVEFQELQKVKKL